MKPRRNFKFKEKIRAICKQLCSKIEDSESRLKKDNPYG